MRLILVSFALLTLFAVASAQEKPGGPADEKARKTYEHALKSLHDRQTLAAFDDFKKADKQDGGHCRDCQRQIIKYGVQLGEWKAACVAAEEMIAESQSSKEIALAHYQYSLVLMNEALQRHKDEVFAHAHEEAVKALVVVANFPDALFVDGRVLAQLKRDDEAKARFQQLVDMNGAEAVERRRAERYLARPELARAKMAPFFSIMTTDGKQIDMDGLQGKVVLLDFWATWCAPCREALPHIQRVAKKFEGEPLVILSISLDSDENKWKEFIEKNEMTWPQYRDGGFTGPIAKMFDVHAIPHTFTIDADGVLQEEHIGDASIEGKLKKLIARAREPQGFGAPLK
jgi:thiol-disulfide isomerase/thioredoxin